MTVYRGLFARALCNTADVADNEKASQSTGFFIDLKTRVIYFAVASADAAATLTSGSLNLPPLALTI